MFDNLVKKEPEDIFSSSDDTPQVSPPPSVPQPASIAPLPVSKTVQAQVPEAAPPVQKTERSGISTGLKILLFFVAIALVVVAALAIARFFLSSPESRVPEAPVVPEAEATTPAAASTSEPVEKPVELDTDLDGIMDTEELQLGTDLNSPDTDNDGLTDREEVSAYKTNPLISDTDGDNYSDGEEVRNGYNPNGTGKLFQVPSNP